MTGSGRADRRPRILLCDDESVARRATIRALGKATYDFIECDDGSAILEILKPGDDGVDLVLLDLHMPGIDGMGFLRRLDELTASPPPTTISAKWCPTATSVRISSFACG